ncbi:MAG TPA: D-glycero-beta-D-manno-heptose 1,7-bisphosphate 7-phosphatase [Rubrivivax sp.]|nr:D-glycero-beta-D-manno-heptose 1,7-bisphosphate 7-phosphatase [Rubrivivax sp.]
MPHILKLIIVGRDGILNEFHEDHIKAPEEWIAVPGALEALARLHHAGWHVVVATNQSGIGTGMIDMASVNAVHAHMLRSLQAVGGRIDAVFFCPHTPEDNCDCRKPQPGLMLDIARRYGADLRQVPMVCDTLRDLQAAQAAGCEPHLVRSGRAAELGAAQVALWLEQVSGTFVHRDLGEFASHLLEREHLRDSQSGALA